jgi:hypothetical protein
MGPFQQGRNWLTKAICGDCGRQVRKRVELLKLTGLSAELSVGSTPF